MWFGLDLGRNEDGLGLGEGFGGVLREFGDFLI